MFCAVQKVPKPFEATQVQCAKAFCSLRTTSKIVLPGYQAVIMKTGSSHKLEQPLVCCQYARIIKNKVHLFAGRKQETTMEVVLVQCYWTL